MTAVIPKPFVCDDVEAIIIRRMPQGGYFLTGANTEITTRFVEASRSSLGEVQELIETIWGPLDKELDPEPEPPVKPVEIGQVINFPPKLPLFPPARTLEDKPALVEAWSDHGFVRTPLMQYAQSQSGAA